MVHRKGARKGAEGTKNSLGHLDIEICNLRFRI
ncbi:MAG: hypothetical protein HW406_2772 [Candidatus Brocadiaceae bacterium]|nr:hypothetical protein [Candidatus Brocadiaceae bacterium]